ncbi:NAD(P)/FAD-dependent oxidoreductase [Pseudonocardia sp.]|uniref:NAD(P)/FAD-dependent oxidoreductase n=1 Tax=Pseudonocardia sp. TaxID=60912 RepID=UPI003D10D5D2
MQTYRVVVIGAGYAGTIATNRFLGSLSAAERRRVALTVVNPRTDFVERIRLHELAAGTRPAVGHPLSGILHPDAQLLEGTATRIDAAARTVTVATADGTVTLPFDRLLYAAGSVAAAPVPGAREHAFLLGDLDGAQRAAAAVRAAGPGTRVLVVGGGPTGVEAAAELAERHPEHAVTLVSATPVLSFMRPAARRSILRTLRRLGVTVEEDSTVAAVEDGRVRLGDGRLLGFDVCVLAASFVAPGLAADSGLTVDALRRLRVDEFLQAQDAPAIVGAGDAVVLPARVGGHLRMACATALPLGVHAASVLLAGLRGAPPAPASVGFVAQCLSLGRRSGYFQLVRRDDSPRPFHVGGRIAAWVKELICRSTVTMPRRVGAHPGSFPVPAGPRVAA